MDPIQAVSSITAVVDAIKKARNVAKRLKDAEVQEILLDAQERALNLQEELVTLRAENIALKEQLDTKHNVTFDGGAYWAKTADGRDGPFCTRCHEVDRRLVRLHATYDFWHHCPDCEENFEVTSAQRKPGLPFV